MSKSLPIVALIGAGHLGSRHLQGLAKIKRDIKIEVVDPNPDALERAKNLFAEMPLNACVRSINYSVSQKNLVNDLHMAIIATNADVRHKVIEELVSRVQVKYMILEKVVFQSVMDFEEAILLLGKKKIDAWVNCPRRIFPFFRELKKETRLSEKVCIRVQGSNWGMACNSIHMLDILSFLTGQTNFTLDAKNLDKDIFESKRKGFMELGGRLVASSERGDQLEMTDVRPKEAPFKFSIYFDGKQIEVDQSSGWINKQSINTQENSFKKKYKFPMQSEITAILVEEILLSGQSQLTSLHESFMLHKPLIDSFNNHFSIVLNKPVTVCPIT